MTKNRTSLPIGYQLQKFRIQSILGQNSFSITYLAQNPKIKFKVAIKEYFPDKLAIREQNYRIQPKSQQDEEHFNWGLEQFIKEGQILTAVLHPNIVRVLSYFEIHHTAYIVMEYEQGQSLSNFLKKGKTISEAKIMAFLPPLLSALQTIHEAGIIHQDIKPDNIYLRRKDRTPILLDFGMARYAFAHRCRHVTRIVNPGYAPLEQYQFKSNTGPWTDIYALGAILYRAVCGEIPVKAPARVHAIKQDEKDPLLATLKIAQNHYSEDLLLGIDWSLKVAIEDRPQTVSQWLNVWRNNNKVLNLKGLNKIFLKEQVSQIVETKPPKSQFPKSIVSSLKRFKGWAAIIVAIGLLTGGYVFYTQRLTQLQEQHTLELQRVQQQKVQLQIVRLQSSQKVLEKTQQQLEEIQKARETEQQQLGELQSEKAALQQKLENTQRQFYFSQKLRKKVNIKEARTGDIIRDRLQENCYAPEMVLLPAGQFRMGTFQERGNEQPVHWVSIKSVAMGRYEVTFAEYDYFADKTGRKKPSDEGWGRDNRPVINVSWEDATAYATWLTQQTGQTYRLPTEAEWEYAARAGTMTQYWWGNEIGSNLAHCKGCSNQWEQKTALVGSFDANPFGLHDMGGNVREWTCSEYEEKYNGKEQHCHSSKQSSYRVERGGSWLNNPWSVRVTARIGNTPTGRYTNVGFRLVKQ